MGDVTNLCDVSDDEQNKKSKEEFEESQAPQERVIRAWMDYEVDL